jgi:N-formylglutamate deformylase
MKLTPIAVFHIPHSSLLIPPDTRPSLALNDAELDIELRRMTDRYTDELFECESAAKIIFPVSRLVVDPERFVNDDDEPMAKLGMGAVYVRDSKGQPLRAGFTPQDKLKLIQKYYKPHHKKLNKAVSEALSVYGRCLIIDCHSFPSTPLEYEVDKSDRPDICIGTDEFHTPKSLKDLARRFFRQAGFSIKINSPFHGAIVPQRYYRTSNKVSSIMIELNRRLYMDENTGGRNALFSRTRDTMRPILDSVIEFFRRGAN